MSNTDFPQLKAQEIVEKFKDKEFALYHINELVKETWLSERSQFWIAVREIIEKV